MAWAKIPWSITGCIAPGSMPRAGAALAAGVSADAGAAKAQRVAARMMRVLMRHAPRGTSPSPCGRGDGNGTPSARARGGDEITQALARFDVDRVLVGAVFAVAVLQLAPQPVQMDRVLHHRVVDQHEPDPVAALELDRPGFGKLLAVEAPDEALHVAGEMQRDLVRRRARVVAGH